MESLALAYLASGIGVAGAVIGAALGIGKLASAAVESIARQPEASGDIRGAMILTAVLIEGVAVVGLVVCILLSPIVAG